MKIHEELVELRAQEKRVTFQILEKLQLMEDCKGYLRLGYRIDHIIPVRMGGDQSPENLQVLCAAHSRMKG